MAPVAGIIAVVSDTLGGQELLDLAGPGATYRRLDHWVSRGYVHPANRRASSGVPRRFTQFEARVFTLTVHLAVECGLIPEIAASAARTLLESGTGSIPLGEGVTLHVEMSDRRWSEPESTSA